MRGRSTCCLLKVQEGRDDARNATGEGMHERDDKAYQDVRVIGAAKLKH